MTDVTRFTVSRLETVRGDTTHLGLFWPPMRLNGCSTDSFFSMTLVSTTTAAHS